MTDKRFHKFLEILLKAEGGFVNHKNDKGGATNYGITQATYDAYRKTNGKKNLAVSKIDKSEVEAIYYGGYYSKIGFIEEEFPHYLMFDLAVNSGPGRAKQCVTEVGNPHDPKEILTWRRQYYNKIVAADPTQQVFLKGWMSRLRLIEKEFS